MTGVAVFVRTLTFSLVLAAVGAAYFWHRTVLVRAVATAETRGRHDALSELRTRRKADIARIAAQTDQDRQREEQDRALVKELENAPSIDDDCRVSGDALRLLDAVGTRPPPSS